MLATFRAALGELGARGGEVEAVSSAYRTEPLLPPGEPPGSMPAYWNAACRLRTSLEPLNLLELLKQLEREAGRKQRQRWGARELDLDLLLYGDRRLSLPGLEVPHAAMHQRVFVLRPLCDIAATEEVPGLGARVEELLRRCGDREAGIIEVRERWR